MAALLIDLDDTLLPDKQARDSALSQVLREGHSCVSPEDGLPMIRNHWRECAVRALPAMTGVSSWEALWTDFAACGLDAADSAAGIAFQHDVWRTLLPNIAPGAAARDFVAAREARLEPYPWAAARLAALTSQHELWCVTNGSSYLQRRKLVRTRLDRYFTQVLVSGELGATKASPGFATEVRGVLAARGEAAGWVIGDREDPDGQLAAALGVPFEKVTPSVAF